MKTQAINIQVGDLFHDRKVTKVDADHEPGFVWVHLSDSTFIRLTHTEIVEVSKHDWVL